MGLKHPGGWHTRAGDQSPEKGLRQAGRPGPCSFSAHCASCTESHWETWPLPRPPSGWSGTQPSPASLGLGVLPSRGWSLSWTQTGRSTWQPRIRKMRGIVEPALPSERRADSCSTAALERGGGTAQRQGWRWKQKASLSVHLLTLPRLPGRVPGQLATHDRRSSGAYPSYEETQQ